MAKFRAKRMDHFEWLAFELAYEMVFQMLGGAKDAALFCARIPGSDESLALIPSYRAAVVEAASPGGWYDTDETSGHDWSLIVGHGDPFMRVGDDQLDAAQAPAGELAQEGGPEGFGLGRPDIHAENFTAAIAVDADRDDHRDRDDPPVLADLHISRIDPQVGPVPLDRAVKKGVDALVDILAQPADLALGDAVHPQSLDQIID